MIAGAIATLVACSDEDSLDTDPKPLDMTTNFIPADNDNSEEAQMRRDFYNRNGCYLLFNDTLRHEYLGLDFNGDSTYFTELLDIAYDVGAYNNNSSSERYYYQHLTNIDDKRTAIEYLEANILPHIGKAIQPFSWLLTNRITKYTVSTRATTNPYAVTGQRCIAIAVYPLWSIKTETQLASLNRQILIIIIQKIVSNNSSKFDGFYLISDRDYNNTFDAEGITNDENTDILAQAGFIVRGKSDSWGTMMNGKYPNRTDDLNSFARQTINRTREQILTQYADYPKVLQKDSIIRATLTSLGYVY